MGVLAVRFRPIPAERGLEDRQLRPLLAQLVGIATLLGFVLPLAYG